MRTLCMHAMNIVYIMQAVKVHTGGGYGGTPARPGERFYHGKCKKAFFDRIKYTPHR